MDDADGTSTFAVRGSLALAFTLSAARLSQVVFVMLVTRAVGEDFGRYTVAAALLVFGGFLADFGTAPALVRLVSRSPGEAAGLVGGTLLASLALGLLGWGAIVVAAAWLYDATTVTDAAVMGASLPLTAMLTSVFAALDGTGRISTRAWLSLVNPALVALGGGLLVVWSGDIRAAMWMQPAAAAIVLVLAVAASPLTGVRDLRPDRRVVREVFTIAAPFAVLAGLGVVSARFDVLLLGYYHGGADAAAYDIGLRGTEALWGLHTAITAPALVVLSRRLGAGDRDGTQRAYGLALRYSYLLGVVAATLLVALRDEVVQVLGAEDFEGAALSVAVLGGALWLTFAALVQGTLITAGNHLRQGIAVAAAITLATVVADVILIDRYGVAGAAWASVGASVVTVLGFAGLHRRTAGLHTAAPPLLLIVVGVAAAGAGLAVDGSALRVATTVGVLVVGLLATKSVSRTDLDRLRSALPGGR